MLASFGRFLSLKLNVDVFHFISKSNAALCGARDVGFRCKENPYDTDDMIYKASSYNRSTCPSSH